MRAAWVENAREKNVELNFFRRVCLRNEGTLRVAAAAAFKVFINGTFVCAGPKRVAAGFAALDVLTLPAGELDVCVEAVHYGIPSFEYVSQPPFLALEIEEAGRIIATVFDFFCRRNPARVQRVERYSCQRNFLECYDYSSFPSELRRGKSALPEEKLAEVAMPALILSEGYAPTLAEYPIDREVSRGRICEKEQFYEEIIPPYAQVKDSAQGYFDGELEVRVSAEASRIGFIEEPTAGEAIENGYRAYLLEEEKTGYFGAELEAECGAEMFLIFDEIVPDGGELERIPGGKFFRGDRFPVAFNRLTSVNALKYTFRRAGRYSISSFEPYSLKVLKVAVKGRITISRLYLKLCENGAVRADFRFAGEAAAVIGGAVNTFRQNAVDLFMDCPSRERAGWLCDSFFTARAEQLLTGQSRVEKAFLTNYLIAPPCRNLPPEMFPMCYPADFSNGNYIPNWALWLIVELRDRLERTGDFETVAAFREKIYRLLEFFRRYENEYGLLENLDKWIFVEWSDSNRYVRDVSYPTNMLYAGALSAAGELYGDMSLSEKGAQIRETIVRQAFRGEFFADHARRVDGKLEVMPQATETCQYYAIFFGLADGEAFAPFRSRMIASFGVRDRKDYPEIAPSNMFIGKFLRLEILKRAGLKRRLYEECIENFAYMARRTGTLWENISATASCNHGFASYAANLLVSAVAGYDGCNDGKKEVYFSDYYAPFDAELSLPLADGSSVAVTLKGGKRTVSPGGYRIAYREGGL